MDSNDEMGNEVAQEVAIPEPAPVMPDVQADRATLLIRMLVGLTTSGNGELMARLQELQGDVLADPGLATGEPTAEPATASESIRRLSLALLMRGQKRLTNSINSTAQGSRDLSVGAVRLGVRALNRLTNNPLGRPLRRPIATRARQWEREVAILIKEGEYEERAGKVLAREGAGIIIDEVVDLIADNPELDHLIGELVGQKSSGYAMVMADNARSLTATGDAVIESMLRKVLRRKARLELPPSPVVGQPQTMYQSQPPVERTGQDNG
jgi:hypothetical protein